MHTCTKPSPRYAVPLLPALLSLLLVACAQQPVHRHPALAQRIAAIIEQPRYRSAQWGIAMMSLDDGRVVYQYQADKLMQPASTAKLFTAALAHERLDLGQRLVTEVRAGGPLREGVLAGPLVLRGAGDPSLGSAPSTVHWADDLAEQIAHAGVRRIEGGLIGDATLFTGSRYGEGWEVSDLPSAFAAPTSALSVAENVWSITLQPAPSAGQAAVVRFEPPQLPPPLLGQIQTLPAGQPAQITIVQPPGQAALQLAGGLPSGASVPVRRSMTDPALQAARQLDAALVRQGITLDGPVRSAYWPEQPPVPDTAAVLARVSSPTQEALLRSGLKRSQNLYLQNLLQRIGLATLAGTQTEAQGRTDADATTLSSAGWGLRALPPLLQHAGIADDEVLLVDGTGLARRDLLTAHALLQLLAYLDRQPYAATLRAELPLAGVDGTLRHRFAQDVGRIQAKTGSMSYVHGLAGYAQGRDGQRWAFAILLNNAPAEAGQPSPTQDLDAVLRALIDPP